MPWLVHTNNAPVELENKVALCLSPEGDVYRMISSAVYEEWYFRKQQELAERKRKEQEQERKRTEEMEKVKAPPRAAS